MNVWTALFRAPTMKKNSTDPIVRLGNAAVIVHQDAKAQRFRVQAASLTLLPNRRVRVRLEGQKGAVVLEMSLVAFWRLTSQLHDQSILADHPAPKQRGRRA